MTKPFNIFYTCPHCGHRVSAETGFGRWMRNHPKLDSAKGIVRTDTDHTILRYRTHKQGREFQLLIDLEVKEFGAKPDMSQKDIIVIKHQLMSEKGKNKYGAATMKTKKVKSIASGRRVRVRYLGYHLLQFERTNPDDSKWIKWDHVMISKNTLIRLLLLDLDPNNPDRSMDELLRDRHIPRIQPGLFD